MGDLTQLEHSGYYAVIRALFACDRLESFVSCFEGERAAEADVHARLSAIGAPPPTAGER